MNAAMSGAVASRIAHGGLCLSGREFNRLGGFIHSECGIKMPPAKRSMLEARLRKRVSNLGLSSFSEYCDYLFSAEGMEKELIPMLDAVTTNKTDFFREPKHFEYLYNAVLPELVSRGAGMNRRLTLWSAGCSTGEEPYTIAMCMGEFAEGRPDFQYRILATDISTRVLEKAKSAIYEEDKAEPVAMEFKKKYFLRSKDRGLGLVRVAPRLRLKVEFRRLNFMDEDFDIAEPVDVIFYRNVMIYFDRPTQERILNRLCRRLSTGGYLFTGHSETLHGMKAPLVQVATTVYRKTL